MLYHYLYISTEYTSYHNIRANRHHYDGECLHDIYARALHPCFSYRLYVKQTFPFTVIFQSSCGTKKGLIKNSQIYTAYKLLSIPLINNLPESPDLNLLKINKHRYMSTQYGTALQHRSLG